MEKFFFISTTDDKFLNALNQQWGINNSYIMASDEKVYNIALNKKYTDIIAAKLISDSFNINDKIYNFFRVLFIFFKKFNSTGQALIMLFLLLGTLIALPFFLIIDIFSFFIFYIPYWIHGKAETRCKTNFNIQIYIKCTLMVLKRILPSMKVPPTSLLATFIAKQSTFLNHTYSIIYLYNSLSSEPKMVVFDDKKMYLPLLLLRKKYNFKVVYVDKMGVEVNNKIFIKILNSSWLPKLLPLKKES